jgi:beta-lactamase superfamily II metal-dependent hydrolase
MGYEIDFLAVGDQSKSGDAIAFRSGNLHGRRHEQFVMIIDGGTKEAGEDLVNHVATHYGTRTVDLVVSTHPDADHASGLTVVLEELVVQRLWMHRPWEHAEDIRHLFQSDRITDRSLRSSIRAALENAHELETIARRKGIPISEPFSGVDLGYTGIHVLGPSKSFYQSLLPHFRDTPEPKSQMSALVESILNAAERAVTWLAESWNIETLADPDDETNWRSAENNSSVVLLLELGDGQGALFTADAAEPALSAAIDRAESVGFDLPSFARFVQIPHHGSKHNVGPTILDRLVGPKQRDRSTAKTAFVSAAKEGAPSHPSRKVTNAFQRRGARVLATQGVSKFHYSNAPQRIGWSPAEPLPFYDQVED